MSLRTTLSAIVAASLLGFAHLATSQSPIRVEQAWIRGTVDGQQSTGAFMTITPATDVSLVAVQTDIARIAEVHEMAMDNGAMRMRAVPKLALKAGRATELSPGAYHVMLMGLTRALKVGERVPLALTFEDAKGKRESVSIQAEVRPLTAH